MSDNIELRMKYTRLLEAIARAFPPTDPGDDPVKRGAIAVAVASGPPPTPWKVDQLALSKSIAAEMMSAIRLKVMAEKVGNDGALGRASGRISAIVDDWCGTGPIFIFPPPNPPPFPPREWWWDPDPIRRRDDLVSDMMAEIGGMQPGPMVDVATEIALQIMADRQ